MTQDHAWRLRLAVLCKLVEKAQPKPGRTALMKFAYFLQTVRGVPLGYRFEMYNYGPYQSMLLSDLSQAETLKAIKSDTVDYPGGSGYEYSPGKAVDLLCRPVSDELQKYEQDISWVLDQFGTKCASELELLSTIVYAEREMRRKQQDPLRTELSRRVKRIKPHFSEEAIGDAIDELVEKTLIGAT